MERFLINNSKNIDNFLVPISLSLTRPFGGPFVLAIRLSHSHTRFYFIFHVFVCIIFFFVFVLSVQIEFSKHDIQTRWKKIDTNITTPLTIYIFVFSFILTMSLQLNILIHMQDITQNTHTHTQIHFRSFFVIRQFIFNKQPFFSRSSLIQYLS